jgi:hypothetical protein
MHSALQEDQQNSHFPPPQPAPDPAGQWGEVPPAGSVQSLQSIFNEISVMRQEMLVLRGEQTNIRTEQQRMMASLPVSRVPPSPLSNDSVNMGVGLNTANFGDFLRKKRDTFATRMAQPVTTMVHPAVHRELPDYSRIRLTTFSVAAAFAFFEEIDNYKRVDRHPVPAAVLVADHDRDQIIVANGNIQSDYAFTDLSNDELYCAVQRSLRPRTPFEFLASMQDAVKFPTLPTGYRP